MLDFHVDPKLDPFKEIRNVPLNWYTSDLHFNHTRMWEELVPARKTFASVEAMNQGMINRINAKCSVQDTLYVLGDFCMGQDFAKNVSHFAKSLNPRLILIKGNHDEEKSQANRDLLYSLFDEVHDELYVRDWNKTLWLHHYPTNNEDDPRGFKRPQATQKYDFALCGHVHDAWKLKNSCINVGVDVWDFYPINLTHIMLSQLFMENQQ